MEETAGSARMPETPDYSIRRYERQVTTYVAHTDENTGLYVDANGCIARVDMPALAQLRLQQIRYFGHWTAGRQS
jgi:hypothetical protein